MSVDDNVDIFRGVVLYALLALSIGFIVMR